MRKGFRLQVLGYSLIFFLLSTVTCTLYPVYAAESSPSADIKSKLEELKKEIASKAARLKEVVSRKLTNKAYIGTLESEATASATLLTKSGAKILSFNKDTVKPKKLTPGDHVAALGDLDDTGVLNVKKILLVPQPKAGQPLAEKNYLWGQIVSRSGNLLIIKDKDFNTRSVLTKAAVAKEVKINKFVIVSGFTKGEILEASFIFVIP